MDDASFMAALQAAADLLESRKVPPDIDGFDIVRVPFGPDRSGTLEARAVLNTTLSGKIRYTPSYSNAIIMEESAIGVIRKEYSDLWDVLDSSGTMSNEDIARLLWAKWPFDAANDIDAEPIEHAYERLLEYLPSAAPGASDKAIYKWLRKWLVPMAAPDNRETTLGYRYRTIEIAPDDTLVHTGTTELIVRDFHDGLRRIGLNATQPDNEGDGRMRLHAAVAWHSHEGADAVSAYKGYENSGTKPVDPRDKPQILGSLLLRLESLTDEKCPR